jgi:transcriptional regulator with XRE-family HTH domain
MVNLGEKLKSLRLGKRITQTEMANRLGISPIMVSSYELEKRSPSYEVLIKLAAFFGVTTDYLLGLEKERTLNLQGLSDKDIDALNVMVEALRDKGNK